MYYCPSLQFVPASIPTLLTDISTRTPGLPESYTGLILGLDVATNIIFDGMCIRPFHSVLGNWTALSFPFEGTITSNWATTWRLLCSVHTLLIHKQWNGQPYRQILTNCPNWITTEQTSTATHRTCKLKQRRNHNCGETCKTIKFALCPPKLYEVKNPCKECVSDGKVDFIHIKLLSPQQVGITAVLLSNSKMRKPRLATKALVWFWGGH